MDASPKPRVLLIEDTLAIKAIIRVYLSGFELDIAEAQDGQQGFLIACQWNPHLIMTDVTMPGMDGFELCAAVRAHDNLSEVPIVMLTGLRDESSRRKGKLVGVNAFLTKPIRGEELCSTVMNLLKTT